MMQVLCGVYVDFFPNAEKVFALPVKLINKPGCVTILSRPKDFLRGSFQSAPSSVRPPPLRLAKLTPTAPLHKGKA